MLKFAVLCFGGGVRIDLTTNGLLVFDMPDTFWKVLRENKIAIKYTRYPIKFDYEKMVEYIKQKGVYVFTAGPKDGIKYFRKIPLNVKGTFGMNHSFLQCPYTNCTQLRDGKLYHCPPAAFSDLLNRKMKETGEGAGEFLLAKEDYLNLSEIKTRKEVFDFLSNPVPFCQYCDMENRNEMVPWQTSKRDIREWVDV